MCVGVVGVEEGEEGAGPPEDGVCGVMIWFIHSRLSRFKYILAHSLTILFPAVRAAHLSLHLPLHPPQVVFGKVKQGLDIVTAIEAVGSQGGETSKTVTIVDCGELPLGGASS